MGEVTAAQKKQLRKLLGSQDLEVFEQGLALVASLEEPGLLESLTAGLGIGDDGQILFEDGSARRHHVRGAHRIWKALRYLDARGALRGAERLVVASRELADLTPLAGLPALRRLRVETGYARGDLLAPLAGLPALRDLEVRTWRQRLDLSPLLALPSLERCALEIGWRSQELAVVSQLDGLTALRMSGNGDYVDPSPLTALTGLTELELLAGGIEDLSLLRGWPGMRELALRSGWALRSLAGIEACPALVALTLYDCEGVRDLSPLRALPSLERVHLERSLAASDLSPLGALPGLRELTLEPGPGADLSPLAGATGLEVVRVITLKPAPERFTREGEALVMRGQEAIQAFIAWASGG